MASTVDAVPLASGSTSTPTQATEPTTGSEGRDTTTAPRQWRNSIEEAEALDLVDPLRHFLAAPSSDDEDENGEGKGEGIGNQQGKDVRDLKSSTDFSIVPSQRESIINQRATIRYYTSPAISPITFPTSSPPPPPSEEGGENDATAGGTKWYDVTLKLDMTEGCGGKIWPAAEVLGSYIASHYGSRTNRWRGKTVVELGSGTGLVGFLVSMMATGAEVWVTDQIPMLPLMSSNLSLNAPTMVDPCHVAELNWGEPHPSNGVPLKPDVLLLADCVYLEVAFQPLVDTMRNLATQQTEILFCYQKRRKADKRFFNLLKRHFVFSHVEDDDPIRTQAYRRQGTSLLSVSLK